MLGSLKLEIRPGQFFEVYGGPYVEKPRVMTGVKMAMEVQPHGDGSREISIPTKDFQVPDVKLMQKGLIEATRAIVAGKPVYVGCMAGRGRTGLFMSVLARAFGYSSPIAHVRKEYYSHAVETPGQIMYVYEFPIPAEVKRLLWWARVKAVITGKAMLTKQVKV